MTIVNRLPEIDQVQRRFHAFAERNGIPEAIGQKVKVVLDELLNNILSYAYRDKCQHSIEIGISLTGDQLAVQVVDDGIPFNPFEREAPDTNCSLEEREIGGLGIHLVRNVMDQVAYERRAGKNVVTVTKYLGPGTS